MPYVTLIEFQRVSDESQLAKRPTTLDGFHLETLIIYKLGFNQNYYTFAFILLITIVLCSQFH